jgi:hypothetical protein
MSITEKIEAVIPVAKKLCEEIIPIQHLGDKATIQYSVNEYSDGTLHAYFEVRFIPDRAITKEYLKELGDFCEWHHCHFFISTSDNWFYVVITPNEILLKNLEEVKK